MALTLCTLGNFNVFLPSAAFLFQNIFTISFRNIISVSNSLDIHRAGPDSRTKLFANVISRRYTSCSWKRVKVEPDLCGKINLFVFFKVRVILFLLYK